MYTPLDLGNEGEVQAYTKALREGNVTAMTRSQSKAKAALADDEDVVANSLDIVENINSDMVGSESMEVSNSGLRDSESQRSSVVTEHVRNTGNCAEDGELKDEPLWSTVEVDKMMEASAKLDTSEQELSRKEEELRKESSGERGDPVGAGRAVAHGIEVGAVPSVTALEDSVPPGLGKDGGMEKLVTSG